MVRSFLLVFSLSLSLSLSFSLVFGCWLGWRDGRVVWREEEGDAIVRHRRAHIAASSALSRNHPSSAGARVDDRLRAVGAIC